MARPRTKTKAKSRKAKEGDVVLVKWLDAQSRTYWSGVGEGDIAVVHSVGFFVGNKKSEKGEFLQVALSRADDGMVSDILAVPVGCIVSVQPILERIEDGSI